MKVLREFLDALRYPNQHMSVAEPEPTEHALRSAIARTAQLNRELAEEDALVTEAELRVRAKGWSSGP